ncbi:MAG: thiamine phosphate synthase [Acidobacteriota bacterium]|nr:thiamine phosphate synthase [Acidobacteriota bacterium]
MTHSAPRAAVPRTFAISPPELGAKVLLRWTEEVVAGGVEAIQLRAKHLSGAELSALAAAMRRRIPSPLLLSISGRLDVALAAGADGVHLPEDSLPCSTVRELAPGLLIGKSTHSLSAVAAARTAGADYVFFSPVFPPTSKPSSLAPTGLRGLADACGKGLVVVALGGMTADRLSAVQAAGAHGVAGIGSFRGDRLAQTVREAHRVFGRSAANR